MRLPDGCGEDLAGAPWDAGKYLGGRLSQPNEVVAAILGRAKGEIIRFQGASGGFENGLLQARAVRADDDYRANSALEFTGHGALQPCAEVAFALRQAVQPA